LSEAEQATDQAEVIEQAESVVEEITEGSAPSEVEAKAETTAEEPEKEGGVQKRINELTRQRYEESQAREEAIHQATEYKRQLDELQAKQVQGDWQQQQPRLEDFDSEQAWAQAYQNWTHEGVQRQQHAQTQLAQQEQVRQEQLKKQGEIQRKMVDAQAKYSDFNVKISDPNLPSLANLSPAAYEAVIDSDGMADIAYYLANNPAEVYKFQDMSPIRAVKEVAKLESKLSPSNKPAITAAPEPPSKVTGTSTTSTDPDKMTTTEWMAWRNAQLYP